MSSFQVKMPSSFTQRAGQKLLVATAVLSATTCSFAGGCAGKDDAAPVAPSSGQTSPATAGGVTTAGPTAEQEAARKRGMAQGAAMQATLQKGPQPGPK
ncbi:MAG: hypothetical protein H7145_10035 [Akkermansiaceae bacterium]|nr:hypothetical protein [Armatimonadota bacterium]